MFTDRYKFDVETRDIGKEPLEALKGYMQSEKVIDVSVADWETPVLLVLNLNKNEEGPLEAIGASLPSQSIRSWANVLPRQGKPVYLDALPLLRSRDSSLATDGILALPLPLSSQTL